MSDQADTGRHSPPANGARRSCYRELLQRGTWQATLAEGGLASRCAADRMPWHATRPEETLDSTRAPLPPPRCRFAPRAEALTNRPNHGLRGDGRASRSANRVLSTRRRCTTLAARHRPLCSGTSARVTTHPQYRARCTCVLCTTLAARHRRLRSGTSARVTTHPHYRARARAARQPQPKGLGEGVGPRRRGGDGGLPGRRGAAPAAGGPPPASPRHGREPRHAPPRQRGASEGRAGL